MTERTPLHEWEQGDDGSWTHRPVQGGSTPVAGKGVPATEHGALDGLDNDDHPQYLMPAEVLPGDGVVIEYNPDGTIKVNAISQSSAVWGYDTSTTIADPGVGDFRLDAPATTATILAISHVTDGGTDVDRFLASLQAGDTIYMQDQDSATDWARFNIVGVTDFAGWTQIDIAFVSGAGAMVGNNQLVVFTFTTGGGSGGIVTDHGELTGLDDNDHPQYALTSHTHPVQVATWKFGGSDTSTDPGDGYVRISGTGNQPRTFALAKVDADGYTRNLDTVLPGDVIVVTDDPDTPPVTGFARYVINDDASDMGTYVVFTAIRTDTSGTTTPPALETRLRIISYPQAPVTEPDEPAPVGGRYSWDDALAIADPGNGQMRANTADLAAATQLAISVVTSDQWIVPGYGMWPGDIIFVAAEDQSFGTLYEITSLIVHPTWLEVGVRFDRGQSANPVDGTPVLIKWTPQVEENHTHDEYLEPTEVLAGEGVDVTYPGDGTVIINATGESGSAKANYFLRDSTTPPPANGEVKFNNAVILDATVMYLASTDASGSDYGFALQAVQPGDEFTLLEPVSASFFRGYVVSEPIDHTTYWEFNIDTVSAAGSRPVDGTAVEFRLHLGSATSLDHGSLAGLGDDDHPQYAKTSDPGLDEVYVQDLEPPAPGKAAVWIDNDGVTGVAPIVSAIPVGGVIYHAGSTAPPEWLLCDGRAVSRATYAVLYSIIGTTFGTGDGATTFNVPNLVSKFARGLATPGGTGGTETHAHPGTNWRTGTDGSHAHGGNTGSRNIGHDHAINDHTHNHGGTNSSQTGGSTSSSSHSHGGSTEAHTGSNYGESGNGLPWVSSRGHSHGINSSSHSHSLSGTGHSHGIDGATHSHGGSTGNTNPSHDHGISSHDGHDHNIPASTSETNLPPYLNLLPIIYAGV